MWVLVSSFHSSLLFIVLCSSILCLLRLVLLSSSCSCMYAAFCQVLIIDTESSKPVCQSASFIGDVSSSSKRMQYSSAQVGWTSIGLDMRLPLHPNSPSHSVVRPSFPFILHRFLCIIVNEPGMICMCAWDLDAIYSQYKAYCDKVPSHPLPILMSLKPSFVSSQGQVK